MPAATELRIPALEIQQGPNRTLYSFAVDGKTIPRFATVARVGRTEGHELRGYQRPEVLSHIAEIQTYVESPDPMIPNAVVIAFDERVRFEPTAGGSAGVSRPGTLRIPVDESSPDERKPGWIVDGQQRIAAIRQARIRSFPICVTAFITNDDQMQREQFILVNSTKPLPKGLIYELLPTTTSRLPSALQRRRFPAYLLERLNLEHGSPLQGMIQTPTTPGGVVRDNSILRMLENSLSDGLLYQLRDPTSGTGNADGMLAVLGSFWASVRDVFPEAWALPPRRSRLMHGAGIVSLGFIMDAIGDRIRPTSAISRDGFTRELLKVRPICRWTDGYWDLAPTVRRKWNEIQNTPRDIQLLTNHLLSHYRELAGREPTG